MTARARRSLNSAIFLASHSPSHSRTTNESLLQLVALRRQVSLTTRLSLPTLVELPLIPPRRWRQARNQITVMSSTGTMKRYSLSS